MTDAERVMRDKAQPFHVRAAGGYVHLLDTARALIAQAEASNFTDRNGHALEMNAAYQALKDSVSE